MSKTTVETNLNRSFTIQPGWMDKSRHLSAAETNGSRPAKVDSLLTAEEAQQIATALLGDDVMIITDLPEAKIGAWDSRVYSGNVDHTINAEPEKIEQTAKNLLAIAKFIRKVNAEKAEAAAAALAEHEAILKAEQAERESLKARRDALVQEFTGNTLTSYAFASMLSQKAVDRVLELEDAAEASKYVPF